MIEFMLIAGLFFITPTELPYKDPGVDSYVAYCNNQLIKSNGFDQVVFDAYIPEKYHAELSSKAYKDGWSVTIQTTPGFYSWQRCYKFTFTPVR